MSAKVVKKEDRTTGFKQMVPPGGWQRLDIIFSIVFAIAIGPIGWIALSVVLFMYYTGRWRYLTSAEQELGRQEQEAKWNELRTRLQAKADGGINE